MAQNWDYAELSKAAKAAGGPEKYVEMLERASRDAGKMEMLPWVGVVFKITVLRSPARNVRAFFMPARR